MKTSTIELRLAFVLSFVLFSGLISAQSLIPGNNICDYAYQIQCGFSMTGNTTTASSDMLGVTCDVEADAPGIWFKAAPGTGSYAVNNCAVTDFDSRILVFQGECNSLNCVAGNEDFCGEASRVEFPAHPDYWSYIYVTGVAGQTGPVQVQLQCYDCGELPLHPNDDCATATDVLNGVVEETTCCALEDAANLCTPAFETPYGLWYKANSGSYSDLNFELFNLTGTNIALTIFEADASGCSGLVEMACGGPATNSIAGNLDPIFGLAPNTDYYFFVNVLDPSDCGQFSFSVTGETVPVLGCTDVAACNYDPSANVDNGSCLFPELYYDCEGNCINDADGDGICDELEPTECQGPDCCGPGTLWNPATGLCFGFDACPADVNGDGYVDAQDILDLIGSYGSFCP